MINDQLNSINKELTKGNKNMNDISSACSKLMIWIDAVKLLYETNQIIKPMKEKVKVLS